MGVEPALIGVSWPSSETLPPSFSLLLDVTFKDLRQPESLSEGEFGESGVGDMLSTPVLRFKILDCDLTLLGVVA